ncbi:MAG: DNA alkylation repair protein, partial [Planctomycetota bacterium]
MAREVASTLAALQRLSSKKTRDGMARYAIPSHNAFGVAMAAMHTLAKQLGKDHELALALWKTGNYEARTVAAFVADPELVTPAQMDRWCKDFDSWAICDTI